MSMWNRAAETMPREELEKVQLKGLQKTLRRVWGNEFYRSRLEKGGLTSPDDVQSLADLAKLPFLTKDDFRDAYPLAIELVAPHAVQRLLQSLKLHLRVFVARQRFLLAVPHRHVRPPLRRGQGQTPSC